MDPLQRMALQFNVVEIDSRIAEKSMNIVQGFAYVVDNGSKEQKDKLREILGSVNYRTVEEIAALLKVSQANMEEWIYG